MKLKYKVLCIVAIAIIVNNFAVAAKASTEEVIPPNMHYISEQTLSDAKGGILGFSVTIRYFYDDFGCIYLKPARLETSFTQMLKPDGTPVTVDDLRELYSDTEKQVIGQ